MTPQWIDEALCATGIFGTDFFFPEKRSDEKQAQQFCAKCPVAQQCLELAMSNERDYARYGIYGGLTPGQRRELHKATGG